MHRFNNAAAVGLAGILAGAAVFASPAPAERVSLDEIAFADEGRSLSIDAELLGLDPRADVFVSLTASAQVEVACINPRGREVWWRQPDDIELELSGSDSYASDLIESGRLTIDLHTDPLAAAILGAPDCPECRRGREWIEQVKSVRFVAATLIVRQGADELRLACRFAAPSRDGDIPAQDVDCDVR